LSSKKHIPTEDDFFSVDDNKDDDDYWGKSSPIYYGDDRENDDGDDVNVPGSDDKVDDTTDDWEIFRRLSAPVSKSIFWSDDKSVDDSNGDDILNGDDDTYRVVNNDDWGSKSKSNYYYYYQSADDYSGDVKQDDVDKDDDWHVFSPNPFSEDSGPLVQSTKVFTISKSISMVRPPSPINAQKISLGSFSQSGSLGSILVALKSSDSPLRSFVLVITDPTGKKLQVNQYSTHKSHIF